MRLADFVNQFQRRWGEGTNFFRYPVQSFYRLFRREGQKLYEQAELPLGNRQQRRPVSAAKFQGTVGEGTTSGGLTGSSLETKVSAPTKRLHPLSLPVAPIVEAPEVTDPQLLIKSRWDRYRGDTLIGEDAGLHLYAGKSLSSDEPVLIKEYQLSQRDFSLKEIEERQQGFEQLVHLNRKISHGPDFRLVRLIDAACDRKSHRCYLITKPVDHSLSLEAYLATQGAMSASHIREVLRQGLETLQFLHDACWIRFSTERLVKGIPHGNLTLKSLAIRFLEVPNPDFEEQFFLYVADLALWEHLFLPPQSGHFYTTGIVTPGNLADLKQQDLQDLAKVAWQLAGGSFDAAGKPQELVAEHPWEALQDTDLWKYLRRLWGLDTPFASAAVALEELRSLPSPDSYREGSRFEENGSAASPQHHLLWLKLTPLVLMLSLGGTAAMAWWFLSGRVFQGSLPTTELPASGNRLLGDVSVPSPVTYGVEAATAWDAALRRSLSRVDDPGSMGLIAALRTRYHRPDQGPLQLEAVAQEGAQPREQVLEAVATGAVDVGLVQAATSSTTPFTEKNLQFEPVAYDGLGVFVPFGDAYRSRHSIGKLGRSLTVAELGQLYTGVTDTPQFRGQTVKLFVPEDETTLALFATLVLQNDPARVARFEALQQRIAARDAQLYSGPPGSPATGLKIRNTLYEKMLHEFETQGVIGIGFDRLGQMFNQCSVYPLAVGRGHQAVQVLRQAGNQPIRPTTDLCNAKGSYWLEVPTSYPLSTALGVVFSPQSVQGEAFAQMLRTVEGQYLLSEAGLVPQMSLEHIWQEVWGQSP